MAGVGSGAGAVRSGGFSLLELIASVLIVGVVATVAFPRVTRMLASDRVQRAAATVAGDLRAGQALAARSRHATVFRVDAFGGYRVTDPGTTTVLLVRSLRADFGITALSADPDQVTLFAGGTSSGPLTLTLTAGSETRTVRMSRAGLVWVQ